MYIREAHTTDVWQDPDNLADGIKFRKPRSFAELREIGEICVARLGIRLPAVLDTLDNATELAYTGWPDRLYVIDRDGRIAYKSQPGPYGFHARGVEEALKRLVPSGANQVRAAPLISR